jgi:hypothetical protein
VTNAEKETGNRLLGQSASWHRILEAEQAGVVPLTVASRLRWCCTASKEGIHELLAFTHSHAFNSS